MLDLKNYNMVQNLHVQGDKNHKDYTSFGNLIPLIEIIVNFEAKSWLKHTTNI